MCEECHELGQSTDLKPAGAVVSAPFFLRGELVEGQEVVHRSRDLGVSSRRRRSPWTGWCTRAPRCRRCSMSRSRRSSTSWSRPASGSSTPATPSCRTCIDRMAATHVLPRAVLEAQVKGAAAYLDKRLLRTVVEQNFPDPRALDEWVPQQDYTGRQSFVRAFAPRLIHVLPGNSPGRRGEVHRPGRDGEGGQPVQDVLERSLHHRRHLADHGGNRPGPCRSCSRCRPSTGAAATTRWSDALPSAVFRQDRRLGRR